MMRLAALKAEFARRNLEVELVVQSRRSDFRISSDIPNLVILRHFRDLPEALLAKGGSNPRASNVFLMTTILVRLDLVHLKCCWGIKLLVRTEDVAPANEILENGIPPASMCRVSANTINRSALSAIL